MTDRPWWKTLGIDPEEDTLGDALHAYRERAKEAHPDQGGSEDAFERLQAAYRDAVDHYADRME
jgi:DnaJ-class molecular chaperone